MCFHYQQIAFFGFDQNPIDQTFRSRLKDSDFVDSYFVNKIPSRLLIITTANIRNKDLYSLFSNNFDQIIEPLNSCDLIEMDNQDLIGHE